MRFALLLVAAAAAARAEDGAIPVSCSPEATAQVRLGMSLVDNLRLVEAQTAFEKAVALEPSCATAHARLAQLVPARDAETHAKAAVAAASAITGAERTQIDLVAAAVSGDNARVRQLTAKLVEEAPGDFRAHNGLGAQALGDQDYPKAIAEFTRALELNPKATGALNNLGYSYVGEERYDDAVATFRKYAEIAPDEPNAHDSLAEALLNTGRVAEADAEFRKAAAINPKFAGAWLGAAQARMLLGDDRGAATALRNEESVDSRPPARIGQQLAHAYALLAEGKTAASFRKCDEIKAQAKKLGLPAAYFMDALQARLQMREGHLEKALKLANASYADARKATLPAGAKRGVLQGVLIEVVRANALLGKQAETQKALAEMEEVVRPVAQNAFAASQLQNARGIAALATGDTATAIGELQKCIAADFQCLYELERTQERAGDAAGAAATREKFLRTPRRGLEYVYLWKKLGGKPPPAG